jgi:hypothetical protein
MGRTRSFGAVLMAVGSVATLTAPPVAADSSFDDWRDSVCQFGTFSETTGRLLRSADLSGSCQSPKGNPILIGLYSSRSAAQNSELRLFPPTACFVSKEVEDGQMMVFVTPVRGTCRDLVSLMQVFGFMGTSDPSNPVPVGP